MGEVIHLNRPLRCQSCCFPCCLQEIEVSSPPGSVIGTVEQEWSCLYPRFVIKDEAGSEILKIEGPLCPCSCCGDVDFNVVTWMAKRLARSPSSGVGWPEKLSPTRTTLGSASPSTSM